MPEVALSDWNGFLAAHPQAHLLQTGEWGELKSGFGWTAVRLLTPQAGAQILFRKLPFGFTVAYIPKGPVFRQQSTVDANLLWAELDAICRRRRAVFCKLEADDWEAGGASVNPDGWQPSPHNIQPPRTIVIDLRSREEDILARMKQKTRYNIHLAGKKDVTIRAWDDFAGFHQMMLTTGGRDHFGVHSREYYRRAYELFHPVGMCELLVAEFEGRPLAALMVFARGRRAWYVYGASNDEQRNRMPTYLLQWEAMRWARSLGCTEYDLWGVPDEDEPALEAQFESRADGLWGVYRFKRGFGGELKRAAPAVDKIYNPLLYKLYLRRMAGSEGG